MPVPKRARRNYTRAPIMATCCPDKQHFGKGLCRSCYRKQHKIPMTPGAKSRHAIKTKARREVAKAGGSPVCIHKDRPHWKAGYCQECYEKRQNDKRGKYSREEGWRHYLKKTYNITVEEYEQMFIDQGG